MRLLVACLALTLLAACGAVSPPTPTPARPIAVARMRAPTATTVVSVTVVGVPASSQPTVAPAPAPAKPAPKPEAAARKQAQVVRVVDGDTVRLRIDGREEPVRLIGLNTPESVDPRRPVECLGKEASAKAAELLRPGMTVEIEADPTQDTRDRFGRLLLYVWMPGGVLFNREMIRLGYAHEYTYEQPYRYQAEFMAAQREAEAAKAGLWAPGACEGQPPAQTSVPATTKAPAPPPVPTAAPAKQPQAAPVATKPAPIAPAPAKPASKGVPPISKDDCPPSHPIKGNQGSRSTEEWIYHTRESGSYARTDPEECFASTADAEAAGYRAPRR